MSVANHLKSNQVSDSWMVLHLRFTTFVHKRSLSETMEDDWWEALTEDKPIEESKNYQDEVKQQKGIFGKYNLIISSRTDRIDLILSGEKIFSPPNANKIQSLNSTLEPFVDVVSLWLNICPLTTSLAFGASLIMPVGDEDASRGKILQFLPDLHLDPSKISDLAYQINRPRDSKSLPNVQINRRSSWSTPRANIIRIVEDTPERIQLVCKLDLDINTAHIIDGIPKSCTCFIFQELVKLGHEIAEDGDLP